MTGEFKISCEWSDVRADADDAEYGATMADVEISVNDFLVTENLNSWSRSIRKSVLVSAYPLAYWITSSWWRLLYEPLPPYTGPQRPPSTDFRLSHEVAGAGDGYVWPRLIFGSDLKTVQIWSAPSPSVEGQSIRYLGGLGGPFHVRIPDMERALGHFVDLVVSRLAEIGVKNSDLAAFWKEVWSDNSIAEKKLRRITEAQLGYDIDECPEEDLAEALAIRAEAGNDTADEILSVFGHANLPPKQGIDQLRDGPHVTIKPDSTLLASHWKVRSQNPSATAIENARKLRSALHLESDRPVQDTDLSRLLQTSTENLFGLGPEAGRQASLGIRTHGDGYSLFPRKRHPNGQRFEIARIIGDIIEFGCNSNQWLASTDLRTDRQKYQRAFAAEFLCPIDGLKQYLNLQRYDADAYEDAAEHFQVSTNTVTSMLANNGEIDFLWSGLPYVTGDY